MEPPQDLAEHIAGQHAAQFRIVGFQDLERRWRYERPEGHHAAEPDDQREEVRVPQRPQPAIIGDPP